jgi:hypothetical protein
MPETEREFMNFLQITNLFHTERLSPSGLGLLGVYYADIGEAVTYCPDCAEREFGDARTAGKVVLELTALIISLAALVISWAARSISLVLRGGS